jgi:hypothetical protein
MIWNDEPPLVLGCHHKTGSVLLTQFMDRVGSRFTQKLRLSKIVNGSPVDRKAPLSAILNHYQNPDCYINLWFEHEIDVAPDSIRLLHFVRHPVKWVRSAYLYHKKGAPSDSVRWLDRRVFRLKEEQVSYCEVLNRVDSATGLAAEAIRSFPEIIGTALVARTSSCLTHRQQVSLEQLHADFDATMGLICALVGFDETDTSEIIAELKILDLSRASPGQMPQNVTRNSPNSQELERTLEGDPMFHKLFDSAASDMGFRFSEMPRQSRSILPEAIVTTLLNGTSHLCTPWQAVERDRDFMLDGDSITWWLTYALQVSGCGHLMMHSFIQQLLDTNER